MKRQLERYFELLPILVIILIMMAGERRHSKIQPVEFDLSAPAMESQIPHLIFR